MSTLCFLVGRTWSGFLHMPRPTGRPWVIDVGITFYFISQLQISIPLWGYRIIPRTPVPLDLAPEANRPERVQRPIFQSPAGEPWRLEKLDLDLCPIDRCEVGLGLSVHPNYITTWTVSSGWRLDTTLLSVPSVRNRLGSAIRSDFTRSAPGNWGSQDSSLFRTSSLLDHVRSAITGLFGPWCCIIPLGLRTTYIFARVFTPLQINWVIIFSAPYQPVTPRVRLLLAESTKGMIASQIAYQARSLPRHRSACA